MVYDAMGSRDRQDRLDELGGGAAAVFSGVSEADTYIGAAALHWKKLGADEVGREGIEAAEADRRWEGRAVVRPVGRGTGKGRGREKEPGASHNASLLGGALGPCTRNRKSGFRGKAGCHGAV